MDLYPVKMRRSDGSILRNCRLVADGGRTRLWHWPIDAEAPVALIDTDAAPARVGASAAFEVAGQRIDPQRGCGCGHRMHTWVPPQAGAQ